MAIYRRPARHHRPADPACHRWRRLPVHLEPLRVQAAPGIDGAVARHAQGAVGNLVDRPDQRIVEQLARHRRRDRAPVAGGRRSACRRHAGRHRRRGCGPRQGAGAAPGDRALPRQGQVRHRLRRVAGHCRQSGVRLLPCLVPRPDLAAAERRLLGRRHLARDTLHEERPRPVGRARRRRQALRIQEHAGDGDGDRLQRAGPREPAAARERPLRPVHRRRRA